MFIYIYKWLSVWVSDLLWPSPSGLCPNLLCPLVSSPRLAYLVHLTGCFTNLTLFSIYVLFYH